MVTFAATRPSQDDVLELIARTIADRLRPRRVILIGSRARGDARVDSDYDIVVEFDTAGSKPLELEGNTYDLFPDRNWALNVIARITGEIERCANDPGTIDWDIVRQGKVLYSANGNYELSPPASRVRERPQEPPESVAVWLERARNDLGVARQLMGYGERWDYVCFFAQQSAEKNLKAALVRQYIRPERTHDLTELLLDLRAVGVALPSIDADCALLAKYAVATRYGPGMCDENMAREAIAAAERIALVGQR